jgi:hypothetical protein
MVDSKIEEIRSKIILNLGKVGISCQYLPSAYIGLGMPFPKPEVTSFLKSTEERPFMV